MPLTDIGALLEFLQEPTFILAGSGEIVRANAAARKAAGGDPAGRHLAELTSTPPDAIRVYLGRCSGTTAPLIGSLTFRAGDDRPGRRYRTYGARLGGRRLPSDEVAIGLRCLPAETEGFSVLARKVAELNAEIHAGRRTQAALEETLHSNEILLRELHHRVKNNIQMMMGLFSAAQRETDSPEIRAFLTDANRRLMAIGAVQQLMYRSQEIRTIAAGPFLSALCDAVTAAFGPEDRVEVVEANGALSNETAYPLALIVNELLTNAFKYGRRDDDGRAVVELFHRQDGPDHILIVQDRGPGFPQAGPAAGGTGRRASGLGLVRGLCRQIGGTVELETRGGARCTICFRDPAADGPAALGSAAVEPAVLGSAARPHQSAPPSNPPPSASTPSASTPSAPPDPPPRGIG